MTHAALQGTDALLVQGRPGQTGETVLRYADQPDVTVLQGRETASWDASKGDLRIDYPINGFARGQDRRRAPAAADDRRRHRGRHAVALRHGEPAR